MTAYRRLLDHGTETPWASIYIVTICAFIQSLQFTIFFSSLWPYLRTLDPHVSENFMGTIVTFYSIGQCVSAPTFGIYSNRIKQVRLPLLCGFSFMLLGNLIYLSVDFVSSGHKWIILLARVITGLGTGNTSLIRSYAASAPLPQDRSRAIALVNAGVMMGLVWGPAFQVLFVPLSEHGTIHIYNAPAVLASFTNVAGMFLLISKFKEVYVGLDSDTVNHHKSYRGWKLGVMACILARFTQITVITNIETIGSPLSMMMFDFSKEKSVKWNATIHGVQGIVGLICTIPFVMFALGPKCSFRCITFLCLTGLLLFHIFTYPWDIYGEFVKTKQDASGAGCDSKTFSWCSGLPAVSPLIYYGLFASLFQISFGVMNTALSAVYSSIIGTGIQGTMQGIYQMSGSIGRMVGPFLISRIYTSHGPKGVWQLEITVLIVTVCIWLISYRRLK